MGSCVSYFEFFLAWMEEAWTLLPQMRVVEVVEQWQILVLETLAFEQKCVCEGKNRAKNSSVTF